MRIKSKDLLAGIAVALGPIFLKLIGSTLKIKILDPDFSEVPEEARTLVFWHGKMLLPLFIHRDQNIAVMISDHRDGEMIAKIIAKFGRLPFNLTIFLTNSSLISFANFCPSIIFVIKQDYRRMPS